MTDKTYRHAPNDQPLGYARGAGAVYLHLSKRDWDILMSKLVPECTPKPSYSFWLGADAE